MAKPPPPAFAPPPDAATLQTLLRQAITLRRQNDFAGTEKMLRAVLALDPANYDALHMLGMLASEAGNAALAVELIAQAIRIDGSQAAAHYNLGNALRQLQRHVEAIASYDRALALKPDHARAWNNRANALWELKRNEDAVASYDRAVAIDAGFADAWHNRGNALGELQRNDEAIASYRRALAAGGDAVRIEYELAALGAADAPAAAPEKFVAGLFDGYAEKFDSHLVDTLQYRTPQAVMETLQPLLPAAPADILDLGCGTGLCGPLLRPLAKSLAGVDLSQKMLDKAAARGLYDELVCDDITRYLQARTQAFDLVVATDVFVYVGDLQAVFAAAARALRPQGLFAFSVEYADSGDFVLRPSKRYAHSEDYLRRLAAAHGYAVERIEARVIRKDGSTDIDGLLAVLRRG